MHRFLVLIPALVWAQTPAAPPAAPKPSAAKTATSPSTAKKTAPAARPAPKPMTDAAAGKPAVDIQTWGPKIQDLSKTRGARALDKQKATSAAFLTKAAAAPGAQKTASGLVYRELTPGTGASPQASDTVKVHYRGTLIDGTEFDSSYKRNEPAQFPLTRVIKCWTEGVQKMKVGGKAQLICPADIAYGDDGRPGIPGGATLVFEIELLDIPAAPPAAK